MIRTVPIAKIAKLNPSPPRELFDDPQREVSFVPMAQVGEDGRLHNGEARPVGELAQGYTYFADGDVIVAKITPCLQNGKAALVEGLRGGHGFGSTEFHVLRPGPAVNGRYLFYMIWNPAFRHFGEQRFTGSAGQKRMPTSAVADFQIPLPFPDDPKRSLAEQKRIALILDKADAIRHRRHEVAQLTDQLIPGIFYEMFGDPARNPNGFDERPFDEVIADTQYGTAVKANTERRGIPVLRMNNITAEGTFDLADLKWVELVPDEFEQFTVRPGDLLFNRTNSRELVGKTGVWKQAEPFAFAGYLIRVRFDADAVLPDYVSAYLNSSYGKQMLYARAQPSINMSNISATMLRRLTLLVPPLPLQQDFVRQVDSIAPLREAHKVRQLEAGRFFDSLVQRAFRGEL